MKRLLVALSLVAGMASAVFAQPIAGPAGLFIRVGDSIDRLGDVDTTGKSDGACLFFNASTGKWSPGICPAGGGGGASALEVAVGGVQVSSPTVSINFDDDTFLGTQSPAGTANIFVNPSSVTLQGNVFNAANKLLQLDGFGLIPNSLIDGSSVTKLGSSIQLGAETTGDYVASLNAGYAISVGAAGAGATPTIAFVPSQVNSQSWGNNTAGTITWCFSIIGTDPCLSFSHNWISFSGTLQGPNLLVTQAVTDTLQAAGINYPTADGAAGQAIITDGAGNLSFATLGSGSDSLAISSNSVIVSSPTEQIDFIYPIVVDLVGITTAQVFLDPSSVTLLGSSISLGTETEGAYVSSITSISPLLGSIDASGGHLILDIDRSSFTLLGPTLSVDDIPLHGFSHEAGEIDEINVVGLSGLLADAQKIIVSTGGTTVHTSSGINFIEGSNVTIAGEASGGFTNITISATGGGGGGGASSLQVSTDGTEVSSPTATINFLEDFIGNESPSGTANISLSTAIVRVPGVTFVQGDILYYNGSNWVVLSTASASEGQVLTLSSSIPAWDDAPGAGSGEANTGENIGTGEGEIFALKDGTTIQFRTLAAGDNVTIETHTSTVTISATGGAATEAAGTSGQVQFHSPTTAGDFAADSQLYWDNTNKRLGIGTDSPQSRFHMASNAGVTKAIIESTLGTGNTSANIALKKATDASSVAQEWNVGVNTFGHFRLRDETSSRNIWAIEVGAPSDALRLDADGNLGIGTADPNSKLHVVGEIKGSSVTITNLLSKDCLGTNGSGTLIEGDCLSSETPLAVWDSNTSIDTNVSTINFTTNLVSTQSSSGNVAVFLADEITLSSVTVLTALILDYLKNEGCIGTDADGKIIVSSECGDNLGDHVFTMNADADGYELTDIGRTLYRITNSTNPRIYIPIDTLGSRGIHIDGTGDAFEPNLMRGIVIEVEGQFSRGLVVSAAGSNSRAIEATGSASISAGLTVGAEFTLSNRADIIDDGNFLTATTLGNVIAARPAVFVATTTSAGYSGTVLPNSQLILFDEDDFAVSLIDGATVFVTAIGGGGGGGTPLAVWDSGASIDTNVSTINFTTNLGSTQSSSGNVAAFLADEITLSTVNANYVQSDLFRSITNSSTGEAKYQSLINDVVGLGHPGVKIMSVFHDPFGFGADEQASFYFTDSGGDVLSSGWTLGNINFPSELEVIEAGLILKSTSSARFANSNNTSYVDIAAPATITSSHTIRLPSSIGSSGQGLVIDSITGRDVFLKYDTVGGSGESNTASNIGAADGEVFAQKTGVDLEFRTLAAGSNVTIETHTSSVTISASGSGGGGDNLGNHTATETLKMANFGIVDVSTISLKHSSHTITAAGDVAQSFYFEAGGSAHDSAILQSVHMKNAGVMTEAYRFEANEHVANTASPELVIKTRYGTSGSLLPRVGMAATGFPNWTILSNTGFGNGFGRMSFCENFSNYFWNCFGNILWDYTNKRLVLDNSSGFNPRIAIGSGASNKDYGLLFDGNANDGSIIWRHSTDNFETDKAWVFQSTVSVSTMVVSNLSRFSSLLDGDGDNKFLTTNPSGDLILKDAPSGGSGGTPLAVWDSGASIDTNVSTMNFTTNLASTQSSSGNVAVFLKDEITLSTVTATNRMALSSLPNEDCIGTDASGIFVAGTCSGGGGGDNLGNHTATETLKMDGFDITGISTMTTSTGRASIYIATNVLMGANIALPYRPGNGTPQIVGATSAGVIDPTFGIEFVGTSGGSSGSIGFRQNNSLAMAIITNKIEVNRVLEINDGARLSFESGPDTACISQTGDRLFHDTNCDGIKDTGEEFIDNPTGDRETIISTFGVTVPISAASLAPTVTNGFTGGVQTGETATNNVNFDYIALSSHTTNYFQFSYSMPDGWDGSTVTFKAVWNYSNGDQTEGVVFALQGLCRGDLEDIDTAYGSVATVTDAAYILSTDTHITGNSGALTLGGTCAAGDYTVWRGYRDYQHASDTLTGDVRLLELRIHYTRDSISD